MPVDTCAVLARNLRALLTAAGRKTIRGPATALQLENWARPIRGEGGAAVSRKTVRRAASGDDGAVSIEVLTVIAAAYGLEAWQLLVTTFDPHDVPRLARGRGNGDAKAARARPVAREPKGDGAAIHAKRNKPARPAQAKAAKAAKPARRAARVKPAVHRVDPRDLKAA